MNCLCLLSCVFLLNTAAESQVVKGDIKQVKGCNRVCPTPVNGQKAYCGSDGLTYTTKCELNKAKCLAAQNGTVLDSKHRGSCDKQAEKQCSDLSRCKSLNNTKHAVCGSDNTTYPSHCHLKIAACQALVNNRSLTLLHKRECGKFKIVCPQYSECVKAKSFVCGTNGKTYRNSCYFSVAQCRVSKSNQTVKIQSRGPCGGEAATPKPCPQTCPEKSRPVCGTDGKTYANGCLLATAKCRLPAGEKRKLRLKYDGACDNPNAKCLLHKCTVNRNKKPKPVCGTDGKTYKSKCHLRVAKCSRRARRGRPLSIKKWGKCNRKGRKTSGGLG